MTYRGTLVISVTVLLHFMACIGFGKDDSESRILRWLANTKAIRETCRISSEEKYGMPESRSSRTIDYVDSHLALTLKPADSLLVQMAQISNPYYSAVIRQNDQGWVLEQLAESGTSAYRNPFQKGHLTGGYGLVTTGGGILEYVSSGNFEIGQSERRLVRGKEFAIVNLKLNGSSAAELGIFPYDAARIWFDVQENHPFPSRLEIFPSQGKKGATYLYLNFVNTERGPLPSRVEVHTGILNDDQSTSETTPVPPTVYEFDFARIHEVPDREVFFLSHYGLPEPDFYTPPWPWWLYASAAGVGLVLIGVLLLQLGSRLRRRS